MARNKINMSTLAKTWILDLDGTILIHDGPHKECGETLLSGVKEFFAENIKEEDMVVLITAREEEYREQTIKFLQENNIRYDNIIFSAPWGERIIINDTKPEGMITAIAIPVVRDEGLSDIDIIFKEDI